MGLKGYVIGINMLMTVAEVLDDGDGRGHIHCCRINEEGGGKLYILMILIWTLV